MQNNRLTVELVYASPNKQYLVALDLPVGSTVKQAIIASGLLEIFPEIDISRQKIGIFSRLVHLGTVVNAGDRIEIYRPLHIDPKQRRRLRAERST